MSGTCQWAFRYCLPCSLTYCLPKPWATVSTMREHAVLERLSWQWRLKLSCPCSCTECICVYWRYKATSFAMAWDHGEWSWCDCFTPGEISHGSHLIRVPAPVWTIWRRKNCHICSRSWAMCPRLSCLSRANDGYMFTH
jgi:hypothetical protein